MPGGGSRSGIILAGTVILDIVNIISHWPEEESVALVARTAYGAGGPPHNAAAGLVQLGAPFPVTCIGVVGSDSYGDVLVEQAASTGLNTSHIRRIAEAVTSHTQVMSSQVTGRRTFFHQVGVNADLCIEWLMPPDNSGKIFYAGAPGIAKAMDMSGGWPQLLRKARTRGFITALEMVPVAAEIQRKFVPPCLPYTDILVINDSEAEAIADIQVVDGDQLNWMAAERCCSRLLDLGVGEVAVIHHPDGAVGLTRQGELAKAGAVHVPREHIVSTVGAGDAFYAGVLYGLHENWGLQRCLDLGNASAATSLSSATTCGSIRPAMDCLAYAKEHGIKGIG